MVWLLLKFLFIPFCLLPCVKSFDFCTLNCGNQKHTMCEYVAGGGPNCAMYQGGLSSEEKEVILAEHNKVRQKVANGDQSNQPSASDMLVLLWDDDAAETAQRWADQCEKDGHDTCRLSKEGKQAGQNAATGGGTAPRDRKTELKRMVNDWYSEVSDLDPAIIDKFVFSGKMVGHYTQMVWATTSRVGCGFTATEKSNKRFKCQYKLICNYQPAGNFISHPVYKKGDACTQCPKDTKCSKKHSGLCTGDKSDLGEIPTKKGKGSASTFGSSYHILYVVVLWNLILCAYMNNV